MTDVLLEVATAVRAAVLPHLGRPEARRAAGVAVGGDTTFGLDAVAEEAALAVLEEAAGEGLAWYTEDRGLVVRGDARELILLDPIDGTRPAGAGFEAGCVSVAAAPFREDATLGDVTDGLVLELRSGTLLRARRGEGVLIVRNGARQPPTPAGTTRLEHAFWSFGLRGRPAVASAVLLEQLIDRSSVGGGVFDLGSAAFAMTRVVTGQLDAYVDHGQRMYEDVPSTREAFEHLGGGSVLNNSPYDVAAALVICREAGCPVTDARGEPLEGRPLIGDDATVQVSTIAACTPDLHAELLRRVDEGIVRLQRWNPSMG